MSGEALTSGAGYSDARAISARFVTGEGEGAERRRVSIRPEGRTGAFTTVYLERVNFSRPALFVLTAIETAAKIYTQTVGDAGNFIVEAESDGAGGAPVVTELLSLGDVQRVMAAWENEGRVQLETNGGATATLALVPAGAQYLRVRFTPERTWSADPAAGTVLEYSLIPMPLAQ